MRGGVLYLNMRQGIVVIVFMILFMYIGTTMFYSTGLGITDFKLEENNSNDAQYELSYILRSVRSFDYIDCEYAIISDDGQKIGTGSTIMENITDGSFTINETINKTDTSKKAKSVEIKIYTEKFNPELKNPDGTPSQKVFFEQTMDVSK